MDQKLTVLEWGKWLEDHWWVIEKNGNRYRYIDPVSGNSYQLGKAIDVEKNREWVFIPPRISLFWYHDKQGGEYYTYVEICPDCQATRCSTCFGSGYVYNHKDMNTNYNKKRNKPKRKKP